MKRLNLCDVAVAIAMLCSSSAIAQDKTEKAAVQPIEMLTAKVLVLDPDGHPVEGAAVFPSGLRTRIERSSHWLWISDRFGPIPKLKTNEAGIVSMPYPKYVAEKMETGTMTWSVTHPDFVDFREDRSVDDDPAEIKLVRGFRIAVTAVDANTGEEIKNDLYGLLSGYSGKDWKLHDNGMLVSPVFSKQLTSLRIIQMAKGKPILFSELLDVTPNDRSRVLLKDVRLSKGTRLVGKLDDSIPRPIKNGYVTLAINNLDSSESRESNWRWRDKTPIAKDGTFVFESLPPGEVAQAIPICDGWVPSQPDVGSVLRHFPKMANIIRGQTRVFPQLVPLDGETTEATLKMERGASIRAKILKPDGNPLVGAKVYVGTNQLWFNGGSQMLGDSGSSREWLEDIRHGKKLNYEWNPHLMAKTNEDGIVVIDAVPAFVSQSIDIIHDEFEAPLNDDNRRNRIVDLKQGVVTEVTVTMQKKGTEDRGEQEKENDKDDQVKQDDKQNDEEVPDVDSDVGQMDSARLTFILSKLIGLFGAIHQDFRPENYVSVGLAPTGTQISILPKPEPTPIDTTH